MPAKKELSDVSEILNLFQVEKIFMLVIAFAVLIFLARRFKTVSQNLEKKWPNLRLTILQITTVFTFAWYIFGSFFIIYAVLRPPEQVLLGLGGSAALAIGFALKDISSSLIAGVVLLFDRPFQVGDRVKFNDIYGEISHIGLRAVRLITLDDSLVTIPNSQFINNAVSSGNAGALDMMVEVKFHIAPTENIIDIKKILYEIVITSRYAYLKKPVNIVVSEEIIGGTFALVFNVKAYVFDINYEKAYATDITTRAYEYFQRENIQKPRVNLNLPSVDLTPEKVTPSYS